MGKQVGAKVVQRIELGESVIGDAPTKILMLVEYPSREAVLEVFESTEYRAIEAARDRAFLQYNVSFVSTNSLDDIVDDGWS